MPLTCQNTDCDHEFHDSILDPHEAITYEFEDMVWSLDRQAPDGIGIETLYFCSDDCVRAWVGERA